MNEMEKKEKAEREKFLVSMGMDRKERKKMNKREWYIYWIVPTIILIISTILFMQDTMAASFCNRVIFVKDGNIEVELRKNEKQDVFCDKIMKAQKDILKNK